MTSRLATSPGSLSLLYGTLALSSLVGLLCAGPAQADMSGGLAACRALADDAKRLACYDALSPPASGLPGAASTPAVSPSPAAVAPAVPAGGGVLVQGVAPAAPVASFGAETVTRVEDAAHSHMTAHVVGDIDGLKRGAVLHLDNGQVWQSVDDREYSYEGTNPEVTIQHNALGSYWMRLKDGSFNLRVSRIE